MTLYFEKKVQFPPSAQLGNRIHSDIAWHSVFPLLAIGSFDDKKGGLASVYDHFKEETIDVDSSPKQDIQVTAIAWHPIQRYLAIGYETGEVVIWNHDENEIFEGSKSHHGPITLVKWSTNGTVLISTDTLGSLVLWTCNSQGHVQTKAHHDFNDPVVQLIARPKNKDGSKQSGENIERSLGKMTTWRPKTAAKRNATTSGTDNSSNRRRRLKKSLRVGEDGDGLDALAFDDAFDEDVEADDELTGNSGGRYDSRQSSPRSGNAECCFFVGLYSGAIFYLKDNGSCEEMLTSGSSIKYLLFQEHRDVLIVMTEASIMGQFKVDSNGGLNEMNKVKLSGLGDIQISWVGTSSIAVLSKELSIRLWDLETGDNNVLEADPNLSYSPDEVFISVDYQKNTGILSCCTNKGKVIMWKEISPDSKKQQVSSNNNKNNDDDDNGNWEWYNSTTSSSSSTTKEIQWCQVVSGTMVVNGVRDIFILNEHELCATHKDKISVIQTQQNQALVSIAYYLDATPLEAEEEVLPTISDEETEESEDGLEKTSRNKVVEGTLSFEIETDIQIKNFVVDSHSNHICFWSGQEVHVYEVSIDIKPTYHTLVGTFNDKCTSLCLYEQSIFILEPEHVQIRTFQGTLKQTLRFSGAEGFPILLTHNGEYITVATANGYIKVWHVGGREAKIHSTSPNLIDTLSDFGEIIHAKNSVDGSKVVFTVAQKANLTPDSRFFVWDLANETIAAIAFPNYFVTNLFWELETPTFLAAELKLMTEEIADSCNSNVYSLKSTIVFGNTDIEKDDLVEGFDSGSSDFSAPQTATEDETDEKIQQGDYSFRSSRAKLPESQFVTLYYTKEHGIQVHSKMDRVADMSLLGLEVPYLVVLEGRSAITSDANRKNTRKYKQKAKNQAARIGRKVIQDFDELNQKDESTTARNALIQSVYYGIIGDHDKALSVLKPIRTKSIWTKLSKRCVTTGRIDIAVLCFSHIKDARGVLAIQRIQEEEPGEEQLHLARLALHLEMNDIALDLYKKSGRFDHLLEIYKANFQWKAALSLCEKHMRIQLRTTCYEYAKYLEEEDLIDEALEMYEKSDTYRVEVPRMLAERDVDKLEKYVYMKKDKEFYKWWAQYLESGGDLDNAMHFYELANDWLSLVRLYCFAGQIEKAVLITEKVDDRASAYHLARAFEDMQEPLKSAYFYTKASAFASGIRLCKEHQMDDTLWGIALQAEPIEQAEAAKYFETKDDPDYNRAIQLYHRSGYDAKALDLAFTTQEYEALQVVVKDLLQKEDQQTDPELLKKCADFFIANKEYERALDTLTAAKQYVDAMEMCVEYNLPISEETAERLTAPKGAGGVDEATRLKLLLKMGECCMTQGNYHLAAKKFTQGGDKGQAMKALLKSGDTERIIFYANVCRQREIYMMAAHYLQTVDLKTRPQLADTIVQFYTRAKLPESIISFYESCAQSSAEEVDYIRALEFLKKAETTTKDLLQLSTSNNNNDSNKPPPSAVQVAQSLDPRKLQNRLHIVLSKIDYVQKFLTVQRMLEDKNNEVSELIQQLLEDPNVEVSVRKGDIYALLVETFTSLGEYNKAVDVIEEMKSVLSHNPVKYFKGDTLQILQNALGNSQVGLRKNSDTSRSSAGNKKSQKEFFGYGEDGTVITGGDGSAEEDADDVGEEEETDNEGKDEHDMEHNDPEEEIEEEEEDIIDELNHDEDEDSEYEDDGHQDEYRMTSNYGRGHINSRFT